jgi:hypothetical protein
MDDIAGYPDHLSIDSNQALLSQLMACKSSESGKSFVLRMSASPFYPKTLDKIQDDFEAKKQHLNETIIKARDNPEFLDNLKNVVDALTDD